MKSTYNKHVQQVGLARYCLVQTIKCRGFSLPSRCGEFYIHPNHVFLRNLLEDKCNLRGQRVIVRGYK